MKLKLGDVVHYADNTTVQPDAMQEDAWLLELEDIERDSSRILAYETVGKRKPQSAKNSFHAGDVLYGKLRPYLNKVVRADRNGYSSSEIIAIKPNQLDGGYLFHYLKSPRFRDYVQAVTHGVRMPRLGTEQAKAAPFPLPPLAEQKRIAQKLDALLAQVDTLKARIDAIPALLKRFRQCVLQAASTGDLTASWATKEGASNWINLRFRELLRDFRGGASIRPSGETQGTPVLRSSAVRPMLVNFEDVSHFDKSMTLNPNDYAMEGDLIFTRLSGSAEFVGVCGRVKATPRVPTQFPDRLFCARLINSRYAPYLEIFFSSQNYISYIGRNLKSSAGHQRITTETVKNAEIRLPSLEEQTEIVRRVEQLFAYADQLEAKVVAAQQRIDALTKSLLAKAFRGELVPQDPSDEPASVLLDRIRAQRAAAPKPKRGRKAATS
ncbi:restriction endonuclease subunit S [Xanthomonas oryzae]|uniref:restriction endonuclease subunit S n=1 Tax=Xanthomonas oryzae TaxID=347 RepID=UPI0006AC6FBC|nr:restriction endonuclease subunit S [Xanthomonas oryzae]QBI11740.1 restriction endonuclease subunit S [Xanthomonas oryzae pv. oryzae]QBI15292.1 restriction endonuclease subunit S [Xanthomonas oryzae pv. oryzae]QBN33156.1 restriction endonuclease subunit S [Xanthomonas oryzae pv. oryzae]QBN34995.1 restriction endonuclease subunit S [Xanthomonas oryzae pv. oryzae]QBN38583.1 restriction endonuclease subunit S [Xanthomonas oryzae pv. oryzae]